MAPQLPYRNGQEIRERTFQFAVRTVRFCKGVYEAGGFGRLLVAQLVDSSTSMASMLEEASAAESRRDFISKCSIGLKESRESHVRLKVMEAAGIGPATEARELSGEADQLVRIITTIVRNTRKNTPSRIRN